MSFCVSIGTIIFGLTCTPFLTGMKVLEVLPYSSVGGEGRGDMGSRN